MKIDIRARDVESHIIVKEIIDRCLIVDFYSEVFANAYNKGKEYMICYHKKGYTTFGIDMDNKALVK